MVLNFGASLVAHELAILPLPFVNAPGFIYELSVARSLTIEPITYVVVSIGVNEPAEAIVNVVSELALVDDVVDLFADASDLSVWTNLANNVLVVSALAELPVLVDRFLRVLDDVFKAQRTKLIPLVLCRLECNAVRILRPDIVERVLVSSRAIRRRLTLHYSRSWLRNNSLGLAWLRQRLWRLIRHHVYWCRDFPSRVLLRGNLPEIELFEEMDLVVRIDEFRENLSVVSQIVHQKLEGFAIAIKEYLLINFLQLMQTIEHLLESRARNEPKHISLSHHVVRSSNIECNNFAVKLDHGSNLSFVPLPLFSLPENLLLLGVEFALHVHVEPLQKLVVRDQLISDPVVFECPVIEHVVDLGNVLREDLLDLLDARTPDALHVTDSAHPIDIDRLG